MNAGITLTPGSRPDSTSPGAGSIEFSDYESFDYDNPGVVDNPPSSNLYVPPDGGVPEQPPTQGPPPQQSESTGLPPAEQASLPGASGEFVGGFAGGPQDGGYQSDRGANEEDPTQGVSLVFKTVQENNRDV